MTQPIHMTLAEHQQEGGEVCWRRIIFNFSAIGEREGENVKRLIVSYCPACWLIMLYTESLRIPQRMLRSPYVKAI